MSVNSTSNTSGASSSTTVPTWPSCSLRSGKASVNATTSKSLIPVLMVLTPLQNEAAGQPRKIFAAADDPVAAHRSLAGWPTAHKVYHISLARPIGFGRYRIVFANGREERLAKIVRVGGGEAEACGKDARLVTAAPVFGIQAAIRSF